MSDAAHRLLRDALVRRLDPPRRDWLESQLQAAPGTSSDLAFSLVPRKLGADAPLAMTPDELAAAEAALPGWWPADWTVADAARILLAMLPGSKPFPVRFKSLCQTADVAELISLFRGLPLYPQPQELLGPVGDGLRSNVRAVFEAIAHGSPFPRTQFDEHRWNHMLLKALFIGSPLAPIQGLDERRNAELATVLIDFTHERRAAGRPVPWEIWRCVGPFATGARLDDLAHELAHGNDTERRAAALGLSESPDPRAAELLRTAPALAQDVAAGRLAWATLN